MKKLIALLLTAVLCFAFCACGGGSTEMEIELNDDMTGEDVVIASMKAFMDGDLYDKLVGSYEEMTGEAGREFTVTRATEYQIPDLEGKAYHLMMMNADADVYSEPDNCFFDRVILMVDMETGKVYDNYYCLNVSSYIGQMETEEDVLTYCMAVYNSYLMDCNDGIMTSAESDETHVELSADEIAAINEAIR